MKRIISILTILIFYCLSISAIPSTTELPSKTFFKENIEVSNEEKTNSSILKNPKSAKAFGLDDDDTGEAGGGFVGGKDNPLPAGDAIFPMLLMSAVYAFYVRKRKKINIKLMNEISYN